MPYVNDAALALFGLSHGKRRAYQRGCRCEPCVRAENMYRDEWRGSSVAWARRRYRAARAKALSLRRLVRSVVQQYRGARDAAIVARRELQRRK